MKRLLMFSVMMVLFAPLVFGATIYFDRVTTYVDGSAIPSAKIPTIVYRAYTGPSDTGPWTAGGTVTDNLALPALEPAAGTTLWYSVDATLDGMTSARSAAKSKAVPFSLPVVPSIREVK